MNIRQQKKASKKLADRLLSRFTREELVAFAKQYEGKPLDHAWEAFCDKNGRCPEDCGYKQTVPPFQL